MTLTVKQVRVGNMGNYCYIAGAGRECVVIDPAWEPDAIEAVATEMGCEIKAVLLTHGHFDHANAAVELAGRTAVPVWIGEDDARMVKGLEPVFIKDNVKIAAGGIEICPMHTPGHTPGSFCFVAGNDIFTGDTLFIGECGRVDLPGSSPEDMARSLIRLSDLPGNLRVLPGHAYADCPDSTIASEKKFNKWMKLALSDKEEFLRRINA